jgi:hypothetical protein
VSPPRDFGDTSPDFVYVTAPTPLCGTAKCRQGRGDPCESGCTSQAAKSPAPRIPRMTIAPEVQHAQAPGRWRRALAKAWRQMVGAK